MPLYGLTASRLLLTPMLGGPIIAAAAATTWNPADKHADITLSGGNLIATHAANGNSYANLRSTTSKATGKWHFEITIAGGAAGSTGAGLANGSASLSNPNYLGIDTNSICSFGGGGIFFNDAGVASGMSVPDGNTAIFAVDIDNELLWQATGASGNWNGDPANDPATGVGGASFAAGTGPYFIGGSLFELFALTLNVGASAFVRAPSSGFSPWG